MAKYSPLYILAFIIIFALIFMLFAWILQLSYNNSIPAMTKDVETGKEKVSKISYITAVALLFLLSFLPSTALIYNGHLDKK
tara:strand:- start:2004 stop:2249 length:246 start_codon:yes stop_codon:yes gene_type:complete